MIYVGDKPVIAAYIGDKQIFMTALDFTPIAITPQDAPVRPIEPVTEHISDSGVFIQAKEEVSFTGHKRHRLGALTKLLKIKHIKWEK
jgi:hypothetical protein